MIPIFSIVGACSNVGKTTVLCNIVQELKYRGYRVATIKHNSCDFNIDHTGKDTWKYTQAGADTVIISSAQKFAMIENVEKEYNLDSIAKKINNVDIIITEGYKKENKPKLEVFRKGLSKEIISRDEDLFGIVTNTPVNKYIPQFSFEETEKLVDFIERKFLKK
mgnify:CR=1 FL=1